MLYVMVRAATTSLVMIAIRMATAPSDSTQSRLAFTSCSGLFVSSVSMPLPKTGDEGEDVSAGQRSGGGQRAGGKSLLFLVKATHVILRPTAA